MYMSLYSIQVVLPNMKCEPKFIWILHIKKGGACFEKFSATSETATSDFGNLGDSIQNDLTITFK